MGARVAALAIEIFLGLLVAGVLVGGLVPFAHATIGPVSAALIGLAAVVLVVVTAEAIRRRPTRP
jgi:tetrahydromethanopterin S-methyltransferase subunit C